MDLCWSCSQTHPYPLWDWAIVEHSWTESRPPDRPQNSQVNLKGGLVWWESSRPRSGSKREHCFFLSHGMYLFLFMPVLSHREFESAHTKYLFLHKIKISERKLREIWKGENRKPEQCNLKKKKNQQIWLCFLFVCFWDKDERDDQERPIFPWCRDLRKVSLLSLNKLETPNTQSETRINILWQPLRVLFLKHNI